MKLNIKPFIPAPKPVEISPKNYYSSPIGWWKVTTEGDCEGRSTRDLGLYYGHIAEIALSIKDSPMYEYDFSPLEEDIPPPNTIPQYQAVRNACHIGLDINSKTWPSSMSSKTRVNWFTQWFDTADVTVTESSYYKAVYIKANW